MPDNLSPADRSKRMSLVRNRDTKPELTVRRLIHKMGFRYRLHRNDLPGKPDLVFPSIKKVIFVHGCFWHRHVCKAARLPKSNTEYWLPKLEGNKTRDEIHYKALREKGWDVLIVWECDLKQISDLKVRITNFLRKNA